MRTALELAIAGTVAVGLHVGAFALTRTAPQSDAGAGGDGGEDRVSLQAADAGMAALVAEWEKPPETAPAAELAPVAQDTAPPMPAVIDAPAQPQAVALPAPPKADAPPVVDAAPPPVADAPTRRPEPRPERRAEKPAPKPAEPEPPKPEQPQPPKAEQPQTPRAPSEGSRRQTVAAGSGQQATTGAGQGESGAQDGSADARAAWMGAIRSRIERHMRYPRGADGAKGTVLVQVEVAADGRLSALGVAKSSGVAALDEAAIAIVRDAAPFKRAPRDAGGQAARFNVPLTFNP